MRDGVRCPWGKPGPYCTSTVDSDLPPLPTDERDDKADQDEESLLAAKLKSLTLEEEELTKATRIANLRAAVACKQDSVEHLKHQQQETTAAFGAAGTV